jgi:hypothetical protein
MSLAINVMLKWTSMKDVYTARDLYASIAFPLKILLATASLEIIHAILRIVPSSPAVIVPQVLFRLLTIWGVTDYFEAVYNKNQKSL